MDTVLLDEYFTHYEHKAFKRASVGYFCENGTSRLAYYISFSRRITNITMDRNILCYGLVNLHVYIIISRLYILHMRG